MIRAPHTLKRYQEISYSNSKFGGRIWSLTVVDRKDIGEVGQKCSYVSFEMVLSTITSRSAYGVFSDERCYSAILK